MKKQLFLLLGLISAVFSVQAQRTFVDASPSGRQYVRPVEGGGMVVSIDSITPLPEMLARLNGKWEFIETGKAYWIGYTDDMFSIAARRESAIQPLLEFIRNSANPQGKYGAVYCLHLIGINCRIVGRFKEEFANKKAREALLSLLIYPEIAPVIIRLLMRDPW